MPYTITDPFTREKVQIEDFLTDRLRGKYAVGPTMPNGQPEFGYRQMPTCAIQLEAAAEIDRLRRVIEAIKQAALDGKVCDDVAWFSNIETLHDFCEAALAPTYYEQPELALPAAS